MRSGGSGASASTGRAGGADKEREKIVTVYRANRVQRVGEGIYGEMEAAVIRLTGFEPAEAERVVNAVLGPLRLAPSAEWSELETPCGHAHWSGEGEWAFCILEDEDHTESPDRHVANNGESWTTGDPRDVVMREFEKS
jgi:hypothetical protein